MISLGINVRYIGSIRAKLDNKEWRVILLEEMIARGVKEKYRALVRNGTISMLFLCYFDNVWHSFRDEAEKDIGRFSL